MSRSRFVTERHNRIATLHKEIRKVPSGILRRRLVGVYAFKWGLRSATVEGYLDVLEDAGLIINDGELVKPVDEEAPE